MISPSTFLRGLVNVLEPVAGRIRDNQRLRRQLRTLTHEQNREAEPDVCIFGDHVWRCVVVCVYKRQFDADMRHTQSPESTIDDPSPVASNTQQSDEKQCLHQVRFRLYVLLSVAMDT